MGTREAMVVRGWEAGWSRWRLEEGGVTAVRPIKESVKSTGLTDAWESYQFVSSMKKARPSFLARPYDIHRPINVFPKPASFVSST